MSARPRVVVPESTLRAIEAIKNLKRQAGTEKRRRAVHANRSCRSMSRHSPCKQELQRHFWLHVPSSFRHFGGLGALWGALGRGSGKFLEGLGRSCGLLGSLGLLLWPCWWARGANSGRLGAKMDGSWDQLGAFWSQVGRMLEPSWGQVGALGTNLELLDAGKEQFLDFLKNLRTPTVFLPGF